MAKDLKEQIEIMTHYLNGGVVQRCIFGSHNYSDITTEDYLFNFCDYKYRIKEQKQKVTIEKWLMRGDTGSCFVLEGNSSYFEDYRNITKVKLLDTYEVEL